MCSHPQLCAFSPSDEALQSFSILVMIHEIPSEQKKRQILLSIFCLCSTNPVPSILIHPFFPDNWLRLNHTLFLAPKSYLTFRISFWTCFHAVTQSAGFYLYNIPTLLKLLTIPPLPLDLAITMLLALLWTIVTFKTMLPMLEVARSHIHLLASCYCSQHWT